MRFSRAAMFFDCQTQAIDKNWVSKEEEQQHPQQPHQYLLERVTTDHRIWRRVTFVHSTFALVTIVTPQKLPYTNLLFASFDKIPLVS